MRKLFLSASLLVANAAPAHAEASSGGGLMSLQVNLMFWTLLIFVILYFLLSRYAFGPITAAVEKREQALEAAIEAARRDREAAAKLLADHQAQLDASRSEAQKLIADGRAVAEKMRADLIAQTHAEQQDMLARARSEIENEKAKAIADLRREAVDLALAGASKVIEQKLDSAKDRQIVESYLASLGPVNTNRS